jgi:hypothetical protein
MANETVIQWVPQGGKRVTLLLARKGGDHRRRRRPSSALSLRGSSTMSPLRSHTCSTVLTKNYRLEYALNSDTVQLVGQIPSPHRSSREKTRKEKRGAEGLAPHRPRASLLSPPWALSPSARRRRRAKLGGSRRRRAFLPRARGSPSDVARRLGRRAADGGVGRRPRVSTA